MHHRTTDRTVTRGRRPATLVRRYGAATTAVVCGAIAVPAAGMTPTAGAVTVESVTVASADSGPVTVYPAAATGTAKPTFSVPDPNLPGSSWDPWAVTYGPGRYLYVQTFLSDATTFVYAPGQKVPSRVFEVQGPDSEAMAVDIHGYEYVMGGKGSPQVYVASPYASGSASTLYSVPSLRTITPPQQGFIPFPSGMAVEPSGTLLVVSYSAKGNAIEEYQGGPFGSATPVRVIRGTKTGLGTCAGISTCDDVVVTYGARTGTIDVAVSTPTGARISEFSPTASGDVAPLHAINGAATGLAKKVVTGIAAGPSSGQLFVMAKTALVGGTGAVEVFAKGVAGDVAPLRTFTASGTSFADAMGITVSN